MAMLSFGRRWGRWQWHNTLQAVIKVTHKVLNIRSRVQHVGKVPGLHNILYWHYLLW